MLSSQAIILLGQTIDIEELKVTAFSRNKNGMKNRLLSWVETLFCCNFGINEFLFKLRLGSLHDDEIHITVHTIMVLSNLLLQLVIILDFRKHSRMYMTSRTITGICMLFAQYLVMLYQSAK